MSMKVSWRSACLLAGLVPVVATSIPPADSTAFLNRGVTSTAQLIHAVQTNSDVRDHYLRHYGMTANELYAYLWTLRLRSAPKTEVVTVYLVPGSSALPVHKQPLHKGDLVFIDPNGREALLAASGNPLLQGPANVRNMALPSSGIQGSEAFALRDLPDLNVPPIMSIDTRPLTALNIPPDTLADVASDIPPITTTVITAPATPPATPPLPPPAPPIGGGSNNGSPAALLLLLGGGGLVGIIAAGHGGAASTPAPSPTPEPVTIVCLGVGALALVKRRRS